VTPMWISTAWAATTGEPTALTSMGYHSRNPTSRGQEWRRGRRWHCRRRVVRRRGMGHAADRIGPWGTLVAKWERSTHVSGGGGTECTQWAGVASASGRAGLWGGRTRGSVRENDVPFFILSSFFSVVEIKYVLMRDDHVNNPHSVCSQTKEKCKD
jgi:hypothetical protein